MLKNPLKKKLQLNREVIRELTDSDLKKVVGGGTTQGCLGTQSSPCPTLVSCGCPAPSDGCGATRHCQN